MSRFWKILFCVPWFFRPHVCLSNLKHTPSRVSWIPFYEQSRIDKCSIIYKRIIGTLPIYLNDRIIINNNRHSRNTRYANINILCRK